jgi:predicted RNA-binding Zn ribbon-like protein
LVPKGARATARDLDNARELREALRTLLLVNNEVDIDPQPALSVVDKVAERARVELRFHDGGAGLVPRAGGATGGLGQILTAVHASMAEGSWSRLKACRADDCLWAFVDHAKNRSRAWCSMRVCGNREKARAFRERQRA